MDNFGPCLDYIPDEQPRPSDLGVEEPVVKTAKEQNLSDNQSKFSKTSGRSWELYSLYAPSKNYIPGPFKNL